MNIMSVNQHCDLVPTGPGGVCELSGSDTQDPGVQGTCCVLLSLRLTAGLQGLGRKGITMQTGCCAAFL